MTKVSKISFTSWFKVLLVPGLAFISRYKNSAFGTSSQNASIGIGRRTAEIALELGKKILILGSTDLTHYGYNYGFTPKGTGEAAVEWVKNENDRKIVDLMTTQGFQHNDMVYNNKLEVFLCFRKVS